MVISGSSQNGKSYLIKKILEQRNEIITPIIEHIYYCYSEYEPDFFNELRSSIVGVELTFIRGIQPLLDEVICPPGNRIPQLIVLDDLQMEISDNMKRLERLFTNYVHHRNCSVIVSLQYFFKKNLRVLTLQAQYLVLFKSPRCSSYIMDIGMQLNARKKCLALEEAYKYISKFKYSYVFIDLTQGQDDDFRIRSTIFPDENLVIFVPEK